MSRRLLAAVAAAALTVGLAACGDPSEGTKTDPPPSIDIGQSDGGGDGGASDGGGDEGSTEAAPDIPAPDPADYPGMDEQTPEGAEQAFKYFWDVALWSHQTGDSELLRTLYSDVCRGCAGLADDVDAIGMSGDYWTDGAIKAIDVAAEDSLDGHDIGVVYRFILTEHRDPASGGPKGVVHDQEWVAAAGMNWIGEGWLIEDLSSSTEGGVD